MGVDTPPSTFSGIFVEQWTENQFASSRREWQALLARSHADPLFLSWEWQWHWWSLVAKPMGAELHLAVARTAIGQLIGIAPFFRRKVSHRGYVNGYRLESIGSLWRESGGVFSEYLDLIVDADATDHVISKFADWIRGVPSWTDLVVGNTRVGSNSMRLVRALSDQVYLRVCDELEAYAARLPQSFGEYVGSLNAGMRRKVWNLRSRIPNSELELCGPADINQFLDQLDDLHSERWGWRHFVGVKRAFHVRLAESWAEQGALRMSTLRLRGRPLSLMYNVRIGTTEYNIQSGFDASRTSGISPAYLHFGYSIEQACRDGIKTFDFLAGEGKSRQYKRDFQTQKTDVVTIQAIRGPLAWLYRAYDRFRRTDPNESNSKEHDEVQTKI